MVGPQAVARRTGLTIGYVEQYANTGVTRVTVKLLEQFGNTRVLSSPKLMAMNNQTALLKVVDNVVYFQIQSSDQPGYRRPRPIFSRSPPRRRPWRLASSCR